MGLEQIRGDMRGDQGENYVRWDLNRSGIHERRSGRELREVGLEEIRGDMKGGQGENYVRWD